MSRQPLDRRQFVQATAAAATATALSGMAGAFARAAVDAEKLHIATNVYPWITFYRRDQRDFNASLDEGLAEVAASGMSGFEPILNSPQDVDRFAPLLKKHGLEMRSFYVNSELHDAEKAEQSIKDILAIAERAKEITNTRYAVTNPSPVAWGGPENKNDAQLRTQAAALNRLGEKLRTRGITLAYHNHDSELRQAAREFHHMMIATDPKNVTLCLDAHWIYRGAGNSAVALFDVVQLYGRRVSELHIRQSVDNVWTETVCEGDIDYAALTSRLVDMGVRPHLVLEQAVEQNTPKKLSAVAAHQASYTFAQRVFDPFSR
jgi:inosose dehydratase